MPLTRNRNSSPSVPTGVPVFSPGKRRWQRAGACFMEYASYLAGERWSDHPACTHPAIGRLARLVNDKTSDTERSALAPLVSSVIGLRTDDPELGANIEMLVTLLAASAAVPIVSADRKNAMAVTIIRCSHRLRPTGFASAIAAGAAALDTAPAAAAWARAQLDSTAFRDRGRRSIRSAEMMLLAVVGIRHAAPDPDAVLHALLTDVIRECADLLTPSAAAVREDRPSGAGLSTPSGAQFK